jgi:hypothetical protein
VNEYLNNKTFEFLINSFQESKRQIVRIDMLLSEMSETIDRKKGRKLDVSINKREMETKKSMLTESQTNHHSSKQKLAVAFFTLSENIVRYAKFQLIDADDAIQEGVMICFDKIDRFDPRKGKAFNYMTTCILNHFRQLYRTARNYNELKRKYLNHIQFMEGGASFKNGKQMFDPNAPH